MTVYVDDMAAGYGRMVMCHMLADTREELLAMADTIGVQRKWLQKAGHYQEHFDICKTKRAAAVRAGAVEIDRTQLGELLAVRRKAWLEMHNIGLKPTHIIYDEIVSQEAART